MCALAITNSSLTVCVPWNETEIFSSYLLLFIVLTIVDNQSIKLNIFLCNIYFVIALQLFKLWVCIFQAFPEIMCQGILNNDLMCPVTELSKSEHTTDLKCSINCSILPLDVLSHLQYIQQIFVKNHNT